MHLHDNLFLNKLYNLIASETFLQITKSKSLLSYLNIILLLYKKICRIEYTKGQKEFFKSKYLSDYFKQSIKEMMGEKIPQELLSLLNFYHF